MPGGIGEKRIRVAVADGEGVFRLGLKRLFGVEEDLWVVAEAQELDGLAQLVRELKPDVIFLQAELANQNQDRVLTVSELKQAAAGSRVIISFERGSLARVDTVRCLGCDPEISGSSPFVKCARKVAADEIWLPKKQVAKMATLLEASHSTRPRDTLTSREKTIISYLLQGSRNREIAAHLAISEQTVKNHLRTVYDKVGVSDRLELVLYALHQNLELPPLERSASPEASASKVQPRRLPKSASGSYFPADLRPAKDQPVQ